MERIFNKRAGEGVVSIMDPLKVLRYPVVTEKTTRMIQHENKITFIVDKKATKKEIKEAFERLFNVKVEKVNVLITPKGLKKAYIKLRKEYKATDVAAKIGIL